MKFPKAIKQMVKLCVGVHSDFLSRVDNFNKIMEMKNRIATLSDYNFANAFDYTAKVICARRTTPNTETYLSLGEKAIELLARGQEQADVLYYFDELLREEDEKND